ncbi:shikimate kinase [Ammonicoccus fulvus]|uniref:Shikimate kinase n=1 Tax=Ammonicoccus fulvus TaxID=3138240 RepID=A0ABZ3FQ18_9ACTN
MTVVVMGAPGSGKSTIGPLLAQALGREFVDVDAAIEADEKQTIADIFVLHGEPHFRQLEKTATAVALQNGGVVALGGGAVMNEDTRASLKDHDVVWLECSITTATKRIGLDQARPLLLGNVRSQLVQLLNVRTPLYRECATITVKTDDREPGDIVAEILEQLT